MIKPDLQFLQLPGGLEVELKVPTLQSQVGSPGNQPYFKYFPKVTHKHNKRHLWSSHHLRNSKGFRNQIQKPDKDHDLFLILNHSITKSLDGTIHLKSWHVSPLAHDFSSIVQEPFLENNSGPCRVISLMSEKFFFHLGSIV